MQERYSRQIPFNFDSNKAPVATYDRLVLATPAFDGNVVHWDAVRPPHASEQDRAALWDLILFGDGGAFVDRIITPVFRALAYEISNKGSKGVEPAMRITYDDANESFVLPQNITRILKDIGACALTRHAPRAPSVASCMHVTVAHSCRQAPARCRHMVSYHHAAAGACVASFRTSFTKSRSAEAALAPASMTHAASCRSVKDPSHAFLQLWNLGSSPTGWDTKAASDKYKGDRENLGWLVKTFQERRTWFATYLAYYRIFAFHIIWFNVLMGLSFAEDRDFDGRWWVGMSSAVITHSVLELVYAAALVFVRLRVPPPPAGQADIRRQVTFNGTWFGAISAFCCCCAPRMLRGSVGVEGARALTEREGKQQAQNTLWRVGRVSSVAGARAINSTGALWMPLLGWLGTVIVLTFLFLAQFSWFPWTASNPEDPDQWQPGGKSPAAFFREFVPSPQHPQSFSTSLHGR